MRTRNDFVFCCYASRYVAWFRVGRARRGLSLSRTSLTFSERNGHRRFVRLPFGWRLSVLHTPPGGTGGREVRYG